jgi:hypothetical protein
VGFSSVKPGDFMAGFFERRRTPLPAVAYALYLYLSGLSLSS